MKSKNDQSGESPRWQGALPSITAPPTPPTRAPQTARVVERKGMAPAFPRCTMGRRRHVLALFHYFPPPPTHSPFSLRERHPTFRFHASTGGPSPHPINPNPHRNHLPAESARPRGRCSRVSRRKQPPPGGRRVRARSWPASRSLRQEKTSAPSRRPRTHEKIRARRRPLRSGRGRRTG